MSDQETKPMKQRLARPPLPATGKLAIGAGLLAAFGLGLCISGGGTASDQHGDGAHAEHEEPVWTCPMHPQIRGPDPGKCPICGMDLVEVATASDGGEDEGSDPRRIALSERAKVLARITTTRARAMPAAEREGRLLGRLDYDETRVRTISAWVPGRLDRLYVDFTGTRVRKGDHLMWLYSTEILTAQEDLLQWKRGNLDEAVWQRDLSTIRPWLRSPGVREWYSRNAIEFTPEFSTMLKREIEIPLKRGSAV